MEICLKPKDTKQNLHLKMAVQVPFEEEKLCLAFKEDGRERH